jgi:hypothetical protein
VATRHGLFWLALRGSLAAYLPSGELLTCSTLSFKVTDTFSMSLLPSNSTLILIAEPNSVNLHQFRLRRSGSTDELEELRGRRNNSIEDLVNVCNSPGLRWQAR